MNEPDGSTDLLRFLANAPVADLTKIEIKGIELLFADFLAITASYLKECESLEYQGLSGSDLATYLAIASSKGDMDDVDWQMIHHPGSIIFPAVLALGLEKGSSSTDFLKAVSVGYRTAAVFSGLMTPAIRQTWHSTSMSGAMGAAHAVTALTNSSPDLAYATLNLTCTNLGGLAQAGIERNGAAQFNRGAAAALSIGALRAAHMDSPFLPNSFETLMKAWDQDPRAAIASSKGFMNQGVGLSTASLRLLPVSGYMQAAVYGAIVAGYPDAGAKELDLYIAPSTYRLTVAEQSPYEWVDRYWWNLPETINLIDRGVNPLDRRLVEPMASQELSVTFHEDSNLRPDQARIEFRAITGETVSENFVAPGVFPFDEVARSLWELKCTQWLGVSPSAHMETSGEVLRNGLKGMSVTSLFKV